MSPSGRGARFKRGDIVVAPAWFKGRAKVLDVCEEYNAIKVRFVGKGGRLPSRWLEAAPFSTPEEAVARALMEDE